MAQGRTKHSARVDDVLASEGEETSHPSIDEVEWLDDSEDAIEIVTELDDGDATPGNLTDRERRLRSELASVLRPNGFPAERDALIRVARAEQAADWILEALNRLPIDTRFDTVQDVWVVLGGHREQRDAIQPHQPHQPLDDRSDDALVEPSAKSLPAAQPVQPGEPGPADLLLGLIVGGCAVGFQLVRAVVSSCRHTVERMTRLGS